MEITKTYINSNKKSSKNSSRDEFLNESITSYIDNHQTFSRIKSDEFGSKNHPRKILSSHKKSTRRTGKPPGSPDQSHANPEVIVQNRNIYQFSEVTAKENEDNPSFGKLCNSNTNLKSYRSIGELSKSIPQKRYQQASKKPNYSIYTQQNKENILRNFSNDHDNQMPLALIPRQFMCENKCITSAQFAYKNQDDREIQNADDWMPEHNRFGLERNEYEDNLPIMMRKSQDFRSVFPQLHWNIYHENSTVDRRQNSYSLENTQANACSIEYNNYKIASGEFQVAEINDNAYFQSNLFTTNHQNVDMKSMVPIHVPKYNTKCFGLGKTNHNPNMVLNDCNKSQKLKLRPILNRNSVRDHE